MQKQVRSYIIHRKKEISGTAKKGSEFRKNTAKYIKEHRKKYGSVRTFNRTGRALSKGKRSPSSWSAPLNS